MGDGAASSGALGSDVPGVREFREPPSRPPSAAPGYDGRHVRDDREDLTCASWYPVITPHASPCLPCTLAPPSGSAWMRVCAAAACMCSDLCVRVRVCVEWVSVGGYICLHDCGCLWVCAYAGLSICQCLYVSSCMGDICVCVSLVPLYTCVYVSVYQYMCVCVGS